MHPDTFEILSRNSSEAGWSLESEMVLLCHFVDQLHSRLPGMEDDGILGDFERFLEDQRQMESDQNVIFTLEPPRTLQGVVLPAAERQQLIIDFSEVRNPDKIDPNLLNDDEMGYDENSKYWRWRRAVDMDETTQGLDEWEG